MKKTGLALGVFAALALAIGCAQSDAGITATVKSKLAADTTVQAHEINVDTKNHVVTLTGTVDTQAAKDKAVEIARDTKGVTDVVDNMTVKMAEAAVAPPAGETVGQHVDDAAITAQVKAKLLADATVGGLKIDVDTKEGVVTLTSNKMKSQMEIDQAIRLARTVDGVRDVVSNLSTKAA
ncbi:MAG TPA: BON domain-containing protein [Thermoanaerobaculia bacterium]|jgi:hyperosmotically inducible protein